VFENRVLRGVFGPEMDEETREWKSNITRNLMICIPHLIFFG
jgi:hypothetical protein